MSTDPEDECGLDTDVIPPEAMPLEEESEDLEWFEFIVSSYEEATDLDTDVFWVETVKEGEE